MEKYEILKWLKFIGFEIGLFIAGLFGAFVNTNLMKNLKPYERAGLVLSGGFIATYITPVFISFLSVGESTQFGMAFIIGYMGMTSIAYVVDYIQQKLNIKQKTENQ